MALCANTDGAFECTCSDGFSGDGVTCSQNICNLCDDSASCVDDECKCPMGLSGSGIECRNHLVPVPINREPYSDGNPATCNDQTIQKIQINGNTRIFLQNPTESWKSCIQMVAAASEVEVFAIIDVQQETVANLNRYLDRKVDNLVEIFGTDLSGVLLTNLPAAIELNNYAPLINYVHNHQMKVGVSLVGVSEWAVQFGVRDALYKINLTPRLSGSDN